MAAPVRSSLKTAKFLGRDRDPFLAALNAFSGSERLFLERTSTAALRKAEDLLGVEEPEIPGSNLTMRERECVALLRLGLTDEEIAKVMAITHATVRGHFDQARLKLGAKNRAHLAAKVVP